MLAGFVQLASSVASASRVTNGQHYGEYDSMLAVPALLTDMVFLMWICEMQPSNDGAQDVKGVACASFTIISYTTLALLHQYDVLWMCEMQPSNVRAQDVKDIPFATWGIT